MADLDPNKNASFPITVVGRNEQYTADVINEDGTHKLWVKSTIVPEAIGNLFFERATDGGGSEQLAVDGSITPAEFQVDADPTYDLLIEGLLFEAFDSGIKVDNFLGLSSSISNGVIVEVKSEDNVFQFLPIKTTQEFDSSFSWGSGRSFELIIASGNDSMVARYGVQSPFLIKKQGTYATDDYIKVIIQDDIDQVGSLKFLVAGKRDI